MRPRQAAIALLIALGPATAWAQNPVRWTLVHAGPPAVPGQTFTATVNATIDDGWKVYALTQPAGGPFPVAISLPRQPVFSIGGAADGPLPHTAFDPNFNLETQYHESSADFRVPVRVASDAIGGTHRLRVTVSFQTCNDRLCLPPRDEVLEAAVRISAAPGATHTARANAGTGATTTGDGTPSPAVATAPAPTPAAPSTPRAPVRDVAAASRASTIGTLIGLAALMGALSLLTPCVFPMVPITVSYFTARAGRGRRDAVRQALVYGLGIVLTFTAVGFAIAVLVGASGLNQFAANPWLNLGITALFVAFALSLFGVWELAVPARVLTAAARADHGRGRFAGTLLMGLAFTLTSFTCTAPFLGTLLVLAAHGDWLWPFAGMLAFSLVFAVPFVALAMAPQFLASLPRSGPWLTAIKTSMGLLEMAAALKFLSNADLVWGWGVFTREVVLVAWIAIAFVLAIYLAGWLRLGRSPRLQRPGLVRLAAMAAAVLLGIWLGLGVAGRRLGELEAFLPPADAALVRPDGELPWIVNDYDTARAMAARQGRPLLIDFTGYTCTNCRWMEANMFTRPDVVSELARFVRVRLYTDGRGEPYATHMRMEQEMFGTVALPYYAVIAPDGTPLLAFGGLTRNADEFIAFLREGMKP